MSKFSGHFVVFSSFQYDHQFVSYEDHLLESTLSSGINVNVEVAKMYLRSNGKEKGKKGSCTNNIFTTFSSWWFILTWQVTGVSMQSVLVGRDLNGCAFVCGSLSFLDKISCGLALYFLESFESEFFLHKLWTKTFMFSSTQCNILSYV